MPHAGKHKVDRRSERRGERCQTAGKEKRQHGDFIRVNAAQIRPFAVLRHRDDGRPDERLFQEEVNKIMMMTADAMMRMR